MVLFTGALAPLAEARKAPKQSGPLNFDEKACSRRTEKWRNDKTGRTETVAKTETCALFYTFDPLAEDNDNRDYGIVWVQARIEPRGAWCAKRIWSDLLVSKDTKIHKQTPTKNFKLGKSRRIRIKLATLANGWSDEKGTLSEKTKIRPRRLRHSRFNIEASRVFRQRWNGQTGAVVNLTSGVEISWAIDDPPDALTSGLQYDFERRGSCS
ncbi:MAG: hypothetical protein ACRDK3_15325 [Actinomycetota bacterium]